MMVGSHIDVPGLDQSAVLKKGGRKLSAVVQ
jgi:hypothetical protein